MYMCIYVYMCILQYTHIIYIYMYLYIFIYTNVYVYTYETYRFYRSYHTCMFILSRESVSHLFFWVHIRRPWKRPMNPWRRGESWTSTISLPLRTKRRWGPVFVLWMGEGRFWNSGIEVDEDKYVLKISVLKQQVKKKKC